MKRRVFALLLAMCLLLTGCDWARGSYVSVTPHQEQRPSTQTAMTSAANYRQLVEALTDMIAEGRESAAINVSQYSTEYLEKAMSSAVRHAMTNDPIGAYAVENIEYELGSSGTQPAYSVKINYRKNWVEIQKLQNLKTMEEVQPLIAEALKECAADVVMLVETYEERDIAQMVQTYSFENPQTVMETPAVAVKIYGANKSRVVEVTFQYQTPRDTLRQMQTQIKPVFDAAVLYVSGDGAARQKYYQLYAFLMERFDYTVESSITPAYSLLRKGIGDSQTFATVYAAMCHAAGLECIVVNGTRNGVPRTWNMVMSDLHYYHVDLLHCSEWGKYMQKTDSQMQGYDWDQTAYPACTGTVTEEAVPAAETAEEAVK